MNNDETLQCNAVVQKTATNGEKGEIVGAATEVFFENMEFRGPMTKEFLWKSTKQLRLAEKMGGKL